MTTASHITAAVVETDVQSPLHAHLEGVSSRFAQRVAKIKIIFSKFYDRHVPVGYEDQAGFHFGDQPTPTDSCFEKNSR